jgi:hypothetical protein
MNTAKRKCKSIDQHLHARTILRIFARLKMLRNGFTSGTRSIFVFRRWNIFEDDEMNIKTRVQMSRHHSNFVTLHLAQCKINNLIPMFISEKDRDCCHMGIDCWRMCSKFFISCSLDIMSRIFQSQLYCHPIAVTDENAWRSSMYMDSRCLAGCMVLSWFDRLDRMLFWKLLQELQNFRSHRSISFIATAAIFIHEYL